MGRVRRFADTDAPVEETGVRHSLRRSWIRVLHVFAPAPYGGLEQVVKALAGGQLGIGHDIVVAAILDADAPEHPVLEGLRQKGVDVHAFRLPARSYLRERSAVAELYRRLDPDVLHTHGYRADVLHGRPAKRHGLPIVTTVHGFTGGDWKNRFYEWLQRRAYRNYDAVVAVSQPLAAELAAGGVPARRVHYIPNAWAGEVDFLDRRGARDRLGLDSGRSWAGFVGRMGHEKGADVFVESFAHASGDFGGVMIGDGHLMDRLRERVQEMDLNERVHFPGVVPGAGRLMRALDVFVLSSRTEGTPVALLEAMAAGVPVVATRVGGVPDVVSDREALLVEPDRPRELAAAIDTVLADPGAARARAERARERLRTELDPERWIARYDEVYRTTVARGVS